jgi:type II secretory pathway predicted ATPase ExeA
MITALRNDIQIEDLGNHPEATVAGLQNLLAGDPNVAPDPKRTGFYEVEGRTVTYYIHVSPITGKILLLATWPNKTLPRGATQTA